MNNLFQCLVTLLGRIMLSLIFLMSAAGNKIPQFNQVAEFMSSEGVPAAKLMLAGAIVFLLLGSFSIILGFKARIGASLLLVFLLLATYFFHDFWTLEDAQAKQEEMIQFMKNMALMGAMLMIMANGAGACSLDWKLAKKAVSD